MDAKLGRGRHHELAKIRHWPELTWLRGACDRLLGLTGNFLLDRVLGRFPSSSRMQSKVKNDGTG